MHRHAMIRRSYSGHLTRDRNSFPETDMTSLSEAIKAEYAYKNEKVGLTVYHGEVDKLWTVLK